MFNSKLRSFYDDFGYYKNMVLSTVYKNQVHSRMMSIVLLDDKFYFQTDKSFQKCCDIECNNSVAICADNFSVEGLCKCIGKPRDNKQFCKAFKQAFPTSFELYTFLENEVLYEIKPAYIKRWIYDKGQPYIETFDILNKEYLLKKYNKA